MNSTTERSQVHHTFVLERTYDAPLARVWAAFADKDAKKLWFGPESEDWKISAFEHDFRLGGHDVNEGTFHGEMKSKFVSTYTDIVDGERIVYSYDMWIDEAHISTSVTTIALEADGDNTHLTFTEQGVHLDGHDTGAQREEGTSELLDNLGASLAG